MSDETDDADEPAEKPKKLIKTLSFGLGVMRLYDVRQKTLVVMEDGDTRRKLVYEYLRKASKVIAQTCNVQIAKEYVARALGVDKGDRKGLNLTSSLPKEREQIEELENFVGSNCLSQADRLGRKPAFSGEHGKRIRLGQSALPTHRTDGTHPLMYPEKATLLHFEPGESSHRIAFIIYEAFAGNWAVEQKLPSGWIAFQIKVKPRDKTMIEQLRKIYSGEWELKNSRLRMNPRKVGPAWVGQVVVAYEPQPYKTLSPDIVMGIDMGLNVPACVHIRAPGETRAWAVKMGDGKALIAARSVVRRDIIRLLRALKKKESPLDAAQREGAREKLRELRKREQRLMKTATQRLADRIGDLAKRHGAGVWQMENIGADIKEGKPWLARNWTPGMLKDAVRWQAKKAGAEIKFIKPRYTSQRCAECGHIAPENRPKGAKGAAYFECQGCGHKDDADRNAAKNISTPGIEDLITETLKTIVKS